MTKGGVTVDVRNKSHELTFGPLCYGTGSYFY